MYQLPEMGDFPTYFQPPAGMTPEQQRAYIANSVVNTPNMMGLDPAVAQAWKAMVAQEMVRGNQLRSPNEVLLPIEELYAQRLGAPQMQGENVPNQFFEWLGGRAGPPPSVTGEKPGKGGQSGSGGAGSQLASGIDDNRMNSNMSGMMNGGNNLAGSSNTSFAGMLDQFNRPQNARLDPNYQPPTPSAEPGVIGSPSWNAFQGALNFVMPPLGGLMTAASGIKQIGQEWNNPSQPDGVGFQQNTAMDGGRYTTPTYDMSTSSGLQAYNSDFGRIEREAVGSPTLRERASNAFGSIGNTLFGGNSTESNNRSVSTGPNPSANVSGPNKTGSTSTTGGFNFGNIGQTANNYGSGRSGGSSVGSTNMGTSRSAGQSWGRGNSGNYNDPW